MRYGDIGVASLTQLEEACLEDDTKQRRSLADRWKCIVTSGRLDNLTRWSWMRLHGAECTTEVNSAVLVSISQNMTNTWLE